MNEQMLGLYELAQDLGTAEFMAAVELAGEQHLFGTEYIRAIATRAGVGSRLDEAKGKALALPGGMGQQPAQFQVERQLADYERFVANAAQVFEVTSEVEVRTGIEVAL